MLRTLYGLIEIFDEGLLKKKSNLCWDLANLSIVSHCIGRKIQYSSRWVVEHEKFTLTLYVNGPHILQFTYNAWPFFKQSFIFESQIQSTVSINNCHIISNHFKFTTHQRQTSSYPTVNEQFSFREPFHLSYHVWTKKMFQINI